MIPFRPLILAAGLLAFGFGPAMAQDLQTMAGQMVVVGFQGTNPKDASIRKLAADIADGTIGGIMYLKINVTSLAAVREMNAEFRKAGAELAPFITLDQEGGAVERLTEDVGFKEIPRASVVAAQNNTESAERIYEGMARGIADLGFTVNFGPVVDLAVNPDNPIIAKYGRAFGTDAPLVADYAAAFIEAHHKAGLLTALKHFPGHGSSQGDSHEGFVDITSTWTPEELEPYRLLIEGGYKDMVMVGHLFHADYAGAGEDQLPSSLSHRWITDVLRGDLHFDGVVISDDLEMGAIREHYSLEDTVVTAVKAGVDVLLFSNTSDYRPNLGRQVRDILVEAAQKDPEIAARVEESYNRIVALKKRIGTSESAS